MLKQSNGKRRSPINCDNDRRTRFGEAQRFASCASREASPNLSGGSEDAEGSGDIHPQSRRLLGDDVGHGRQDAVSERYTDGQPVTPESGLGVFADCWSDALRPGGGASRSKDIRLSMTLS